MYPPVIQFETRTRLTKQRAHELQERRRAGRKPRRKGRVLCAAARFLVRRSSAPTFATEAAPPGKTKTDGQSGACF
jgi:hypothetical protein